MEAFDYIIVGAGAAGCVLAGRLSEQRNAKVLLLEAGTRPTSSWISIPAGFTKLLAGARFNWRFQTEPDDNRYGRTIAIPRGKGLGGSTLINGMIYVQGQPQDFDRWAQLGCRGWSADDVLPYFRKIESYHGDDPSGRRGREGPIHVTTMPERHELFEAFLQSAVQAGNRINADYNGGEQDGVGYYQVTQRNGRRWSAYDGYLKPAMLRSNLKVLTDARVTRILLKDGRAAGVTYRHNGEEHSVAARAEVILSAGTVQTPQLLELSGIGAPAVLAAHGIGTRVENVEIGQNYVDHFATRMNWQVSLPITLNEISRGFSLAREVLRYCVSRKGILTFGTGMVFGFVKTRPELETPDIQFFFVHASYANAADRKLDRYPGMTIGVSQLRPDSRGSIHIKSPDINVQPAIRPNFLAARTDQQTFVAGMKIARHIIEQPAMDAYRLKELSPGNQVATDEQWLDFAHRNAQTIYHPVGTCRMGADPHSVVDSQLRVRGVGGLRVVDASVMPTIVSGNTQAAVMMIAEKASDLIRLDWQEN